ncbi:MAG: hypothetical protein HYY96_17515 [Candidatus Tectomicrobia bacterium]|nr:hypothetical protein [Candidatus Tectomicrobia bacterium]
MDELEKQLYERIAALEDEESFRSRLEDLISVYPFNEYEFIISTLLGMDKLTVEEYYDLREEYISRNMFLYIFEISALRGFGGTWAHGHLKELHQELEKPTKKKDQNYRGEYDLLLDNVIKIEVKASRAVEFARDEPLYVKALSSRFTQPFDMNFQQVKPACCHVFVWIGVWRDLIRYWVLASKEVEQSRHFSKGQHRGNIGEGQQSRVFTIMCQCRRSKIQ